MKMLFFLCGLVSVGFVLCISIYLSEHSLLKVIGISDMPFGKVWLPTASTTEPSFGILPFILTSIWGTAGAIMIGVPIGLLTAIYVAKAAPKKVATAIRTSVQLLAGIPSVVYGMIGMVVLVPLIQRTFDLTSGATLMAAIIVLAIMILPSIINVSETALSAVPAEYEEASMALGATKEETWFRVTYPPQGAV